MRDKSDIVLELLKRDDIDLNKQAVSILLKKHKIIYLLKTFRVLGLEMELSFRSNLNY